MEPQSPVHDGSLHHRVRKSLDEWLCRDSCPTPAVRWYLALCPTTKVQMFSEIGKFFKEKDATSAMNAIMDMMDALSLSEKRLFGIESRCNCKLTQLQLLGLLMLFPCFMIRNAFNYASSSLFGVYSCKSDTFNRFLSKP